MKKKDLWIRKTSVQLNIDEDWVHEAVMFSYKYLFQKTKEEEVVLEISGLGKMKVSSTKLRREIQKFEGIVTGLTIRFDRETDEKVRETLRKKITDCQEILRIFKLKDENIKNSKRNLE